MQQSTSYCQTSLTIKFMNFAICLFLIHSSQFFLKKLSSYDLQRERFTVIAFSRKVVNSSERSINFFQLKGGK